MRILGLLVFLTLMSFPLAVEAQTYAVIDRIAFSGDQTYFDYLVADESSRHLYVTRSNEVLVLDLNSGKEIASITKLKRVHGVALANELNKGFITDGGDNSVVVFDLKANLVTRKVKVGEAPDAVLYEPVKKRIYAFNAHSHSASVIDAETETVIATIPLSGIPEFAATDGKGNVYVNIESNSSLVRLDADGMKVQNVWPLAPCEKPSGLAMDTKTHRLFSVCENKVMIVTDAETGKQIAQIAVGAEPDAAIYDAKQKLIFSSNCDGTLTVVRQENPDKYTVLQNVKTQREARTMALDPLTHKLYLPYLDVKPGQKAPDPGNLPEFTPGTFHLIVVAPQT